MKKTPLYFVVFIIPIFFFTSGCTDECVEDLLIEHYLKPSEWFHYVRNYPAFDEAVDGYLQAKAWHREHASLRGERPQGFDTPWVSRGPYNIGGRINTIARHPTEPLVYLAGLTAGGVFKTVDGGANWYPVFDGMPVMAISKIVWDPEDTEVVYVATGDPNISAYVHLGLGLYKSMDAGETWQLLGLEDVGVISAFALDPDEPSTMYAGSMGIVLRPGEERGLYRSEDGGITWQKTLFLSDLAGITDILVDPVDPDVVYASGWRRVRNHAMSIVTGPESRIYRSQDRGMTWDTLTNGLPTGPQSRTGLAWSQGSLFVQFVGTNQQLEGIYRSDDQGDSFAAIPQEGLAANALGGFGWYFAKLRINPYDKNDIFLLGVDLWRTRNSGLSWARATPPWWTYEVHADKHDLFMPAPGVIVLATDGGTYLSLDDALTWSRMDDIPSTQFYRIAYNMHDPSFWVGGSQDNGTTGGYTNPAAWERIFGGDGFQPAFHPLHPELFYAMWQNGNLVMSADYGVTFDEFKNGIQATDRTGWDTPFFISTHPPHGMYIATDRVYINENPFEANWTAISDQLTDPAEPFFPGTHVVTELGESPLVPGLVFAGTGDGRVWKGELTTGNWTNITAGLPEQYVTSCQGSPTYPDRIFVTYSGYRYNSFVPHIHRSDDGGANWVSINGDLPPFAVNDLVILPDTEDMILFAATDAGVYATVNGGENWHLLGDGLPEVPVYDIAHNPALNLLMAGTHARSFFTIDLSSIWDGWVPVATPEPASFYVDVYPNPVSGDLLHVEHRSGGGDLRWQYHLYDASGKLTRNWGAPSGGNRQSLELGLIHNGVYFLHIEGTRSREIRKVLVMR